MIDFVRAAEVLSKHAGTHFRCDGSSVVSEDGRWAFEVLPIKSPAKIQGVKVDDPAKTILILPRMTTRGIQLARKAKLSWVDHLGNADVRANGFVLRVMDHKSQMETGRPSSVGTTIASRVIRVALDDPSMWWKQTDMARAAELSPSLLFTLLKRRGVDGLLDWDGKKFRFNDPQALLSVWAREYDFHSQHRITRCRIDGQSGVEVSANLARALDGTSLNWAMTGLSAAWAYNQHADFGIASAYVEGHVNLEAAGLTPAGQGGNVWLITPAHPYVLWGMRGVGGIPCACPVQVWADLHGHPQRSMEAASALLEETILPAWARPDA